MSDQVLTQTVQANESTNATTVQATTTKQDDIITRASSFKAQPENGVTTSQEAKFDIKSIEKIADPVARKFAEDAYKSFQSDYTRKTQELASQKREVEDLKNRYTFDSPSKIENLLQDQSFIQAAKEYEASKRGTSVNPAGNGLLSEEEFSYLSPEMQKVYLQQKQTQDMVAQLTGKLQSAEVEKEDMTLKTRYTNYDPDVVNRTYQDMMTGKVNATREHLWKVVDYEDAVKRAYSLGQHDAKNGISEARNASTQVRGVTTQTLGSDIPLKGEKQSFQDYWKSLAQSAKTKLGQQ
jgi:hypothetical protein